MNGNEIIIVQGNFYSHCAWFPFGMRFQGVIRKVTFSSLEPNGNPKKGFEISPKYFYYLTNPDLWVRRIGASGCKGARTSTFIAEEKIR